MNYNRDVEAFPLLHHLVNGTCSHDVAANFFSSDLHFSSFVVGWQRSPMRTTLCARFDPQQVPSSSIRGAGLILHCVFVLCRHDLRTPALDMGINMAHRAFVDEQAIVAAAEKEIENRIVSTTSLRCRILVSPRVT